MKTVSSSSSLSPARSHQSSGSSRRQWPFQSSCALPGTLGHLLRLRAGPHGVKMSLQSTSFHNSPGNTWAGGGQWAFFMGSLQPGSPLSNHHLESKVLMQSRAALHYCSPSASFSRAHRPHQGIMSLWMGISPRYTKMLWLKSSPALPQSS